MEAKRFQVWRIGSELPITGNNQVWMNCAPGAKAWLRVGGLWAVKRRVCGLQRIRQDRRGWMLPGAMACSGAVCPWK